MRTALRHTATILALGLIAFGTTRNAEADGTTAGTIIANTASLEYTYGGATTTVNDSVNFTVDRKIIFTVTPTDSQLVEILPAQTWTRLSFRIDNVGNSPMRYQLTATNLGNGSDTALGTSNTAATAAGAVYTDTGHGSAYDAAAPGALIAKDGNLTVYLFVQTPQAGLANGNILAYSLTAQPVQSDGSTLIMQNMSYSVAEYGTATAVDNVLAEGADPYGGDAANNGSYSNRSGFMVAVPTITKTVAPYSDPVNGTTDPRHIPGGIVEYTIRVQNPTSATITSVTVTDTPPVATLGILRSDTTPPAGYAAGKCGQVSTNNGGAWTDIDDSACVVATNTFTYALGDVANGTTTASGTAKLLRFRAVIK